MKNIFKYAVIATALSVGVVSCSEDEFAKDEQNSQVVSNSDLNIKVGNFPSESLRSVPGFDAGKSNWEDNDVIKLTITYYYDDPIERTMKYQSGGWVMQGYAGKPNPSAPIELVAEYTSGTSYEATGVSEYFKFTYSGFASDTITISFERNYSRLRVLAGEDEKSVTLKSNGFFLNGDTEATAESGLVLNSENAKKIDGVYYHNVYFYGSWAAGAELYINDKKYTMAETSVDDKSYAIDLSKKSDLVWVEDNTIYVLEGGKIEEKHVKEALQFTMHGGQTVAVSGVLSDQQDLFDLIELVDNIAYEEEKEVRLNLGEWKGITAITVGGQIQPWLNALYLPNSITHYCVSAVDATYIKNLYVGGEGQYTLEKPKRGSGTAFVNNMLDPEYVQTVLHLGDGVLPRPDVDKINYWGGVQWDAISGVVW